MQAVSPLIEEIKSRRSIRSYDGRPVPEGIISKILEAGIYAPSTLNRQPWKFIVISDRRMIKRLSASVKRTARRILLLYPLLRLFNSRLRRADTRAAIRKTVSGVRDMVFHGAPLLILITAPRGSQSARRDCMFAAQNMMLAAHTVGLGSCYIGRGEFLSSDPKALAMIDMPKDRQIAASIIFGYPSGNPVPVPRRKGPELIRRIK